MAEVSAVAALAHERVELETMRKVNNISVRLLPSPSMSNLAFATERVIFKREQIDVCAESKNRVLMRLFLHFEYPRVRMIKFYLCIADNEL